MPVKKVRIRITDDNRDHNKTFEIEELRALQIEAWGYRALLALSNGGVTKGS